MRPDRAIGRILALVGACWVLVCGTATALLVVHVLQRPSRLGSAAAGEYTGYLIMAIMLLIPGVALLVAGFAGLRFVRTSQEDSARGPSPRIAKPRRLRTGAVVGALVSAVAGFSAAFIVWGLVLGPLLAWLGILEGGGVGLVVMLFICGIGAIAGMLVRERVFLR